MPMHVDPMAVSHTGDDSWGTFVVTTIDHRRIDISYNRESGAYIPVERPTPRPGPTGPMPTA